MSRSELSDILNAMNDCQTCKNPCKKTGYPESRADYTERWQSLEKAPAWLKKRGINEVLICQDCEQLWYLFYQQRELYMEAIKLPEEFKNLCQAKTPARDFLAALKNIPRPGPIRSLLVEMSTKRLRSQSLQAHAELLLESLEDPELSCEVASILIGILNSVIFAAIEIAFPESMTIGSAQREAMAKKLGQNLKGSENLVEATQKAHDQWEKEHPVKFLPPLRHIDLRNLFHWLDHVPPELHLDKYHEVQAVISLRDKIRELLLQISRQSQRKPPVLTLEAQSQKVLAPYNGLKALTQLAQKKLEAQIQALPHWEYLALADLLAVWRRLQLVQDLSKETALQLLHLHQSLSAAASRNSSQIAPSPQIMRALEQLLCHLRKLDNYPAQVKQFVRWHLKQ